MDHAVALVQAYLQLNGYFTSAEYPIIAGAGRRTPRRQRAAGERNDAIAIGLQRAPDRVRILPSRRRRPALPHHLPRTCPRVSAELRDQALEPAPSSAVQRSRIRIPDDARKS